MAFVNAPLADTRTFTQGTSLRTRCSVRPSNLRMGYGDYSYNTDKTQGHTWQYYVDKFRIVTDFVKGQPKTDADAVLGRDKKGGVLMPNDGVPQIADGPLAHDPEAPIDPRVTEATGAAWEWDPDYTAPISLANTNDKDVADDAFLKFRDASAAERGSMLTAQDLGAVEKNKLRSEIGYSESYLLSLEGQHERLGAMADRKGYIPFQSPYGKPTTEIPGMDYMPSIGALDFQKKKANSISFWKDDEAESTGMYKKPKGATKADLPYNTAPAIDEIKVDQAAAGLIVGSE